MLPKSLSDHSPEIDSAFRRCPHPPPCSSRTPSFRWPPFSAPGPVSLSIPSLCTDRDGATSFLCALPFDIYTATGLVLVALLLLALVVLNQRKKAIISDTSKALEETEARYRLIFEHSPIPLLEEDLSTVKTFLDRLTSQGVTDINRFFADNPESLGRCAAMVRIIDANRAACTLYGAQAPGGLRQLSAVLPEDQNFLFKNELLALLKEGRSDIVMENRTLAGAMLTVERRAVVAAGYEQTWQKVIVSVNDITEQVRLRNENMAFERQLQQTQKLEAIGSLAGGIAHDFNNILAPIMGRAELMLVENTGNDPLRDHCRGIIEAAKRARNLVKQILTFSRQVDQEIQPVALAEIVREVIGLVRPTLPATIDVECNLPEGGPRVMADATQLHQVIMNLATNAFHAMEDKGGCLRFHLETVAVGINQSADLSVPPGLYQELRIEDSGHGMDQATIAKIFDPYFTTKPRGKGTGLGLAVVLGSLRGYGGENRLTGESARGTTFTL